MYGVQNIVWSTNILWNTKHWTGHPEALQQISLHGTEDAATVNELSSAEAQQLLMHLMLG